MEHLESTLTVRLAQRSEAGRKPHNQDTVGARLPDGEALTTKGVAIAVADGVSSSDAAREASQVAITGFLTDYYATPDTWRTQESAVRVIESLNRSLWGRGRNNVFGQGFLTTFSALILKGNTGFIFHLGDTRVYRWRSGSLEQLTRDHTRQIDKDTRYLGRALGADPAVEIDMHTLELQKGDLFLLTSDGVHDTLSYGELVQLLRDHHRQPQQLVDAALQRALEKGSQDNLSAQAVYLEQTGNASQSDAVQVLSRLPFPPLLNPGQTLDGLTVDKVLHESTRSQVYLVRDSHGTPLVMKTPSPNFEDDPAYIERFVMEAWIGARIHSPQVVRVVPPRQSRTCLYYLTEHVAGPTLGQLLKERGPLAIPDAVELLEQLIRGIRALHRKDTLHQDLKPDNIVVGARGPVLVDFGSCWVAGIEELGAPFTRDKILGTLDYSAPEYRCGGAIGPRSDQFSLAVLLYEMLTGKTPYGEAYAKAMNLQSFQKLKYVSASRYNPLVPHWLDRALEKALSIHPSSRYDALSEWLQDLQRPNPRYLSASQKPLLERKPERVWQILALTGWAVALILFWWIASR